MTTQRTPPETEAAIAILRGWTKTPTMWTERGKANDYFWDPPPGETGMFRSPDEGPPNYLSEAEHALPLMVELWEAGCDVFRDPVDETYAWNSYGDDGPWPLDNDRDETTDVLVATGMDWLAWKEKR